MKEKSLVHQRVPFSNSSKISIANPVSSHVTRIRAEGAVTTAVYVARVTVPRLFIGKMCVTIAQKRVNRDHN